MILEECDGNPGRRVRSRPKGSVGLSSQRRWVDFRRWLSITWAEIVAHPDPEERRKHLLAGTGVDYAQGVKLTDPRRMAIYFAKYGAGLRYSA